MYNCDKEKINNDDLKSDLNSAYLSVNSGSNRINKIEQYGSPFSPNRIIPVSSSVNVPDSNNTSLNEKLVLGDLNGRHSSFISHFSISTLSSPGNFNVKGGSSAKKDVSSKENMSKKALKSVRSIRQMALFNYSR